MPTHGGSLRSVYKPLGAIFVMGCANQRDGASCDQIEQSSEIAVDALSSLGFSARDVLDVIAPTALTVLATAKGSGVELPDQGVHTLALVLDGASSVREEVWTVSFPLDSACREGMDGSVLAFDANLTVEASDGWLAGSGPVRIVARGPTPGEVFWSGGLVVTPSELLVAASRAKCAECTDLIYGPNFFGDWEGYRSWSTGHVADLFLRDDDGGGFWLFELHAPPGEP